VSEGGIGVVNRPQPIFDHLERMSDGRGLFEHALLETPRREHGYCVDDVARGLIVVCRESRGGLSVRRLARSYLHFILDALENNGRCHNRMSVDGQWQDEAGLGDWWGRALWVLGVAAVGAETAAMRAQALNAFRIAAQQRSPHRRSMAFAALGAAELLRARPGEEAAMAVLRDAVAAIGEPADDDRWPWPEDRLTYANATLAEALIAAGEVLPDPTAVEHGLALLTFLLRVQTRDGHLSMTPVAGLGREDVGPRFDQQPIEVAALADACHTAYRITGEARWIEGITLSWAWFLGDNDSTTRMFDPETGGGYDGLEVDGCNLNQGAESTLAMLATAQHARQLSRSV
jgi:uncharacterized protein YyaL (SSP411 family)